MKKTLIAAAALATVSGVAAAQSNVTIYGIVDTGYVYKTGHDIYMDENVNNRLGFRGVEDLGGGVKATFALEKRFNLYDGTTKGHAKSNTEFDGESTVGLKSARWGAVRFGRVNELTTETIRKFDPFYQYGVGAMLEGSQRSPRISNTMRYDSPVINGFNVGLTFTKGKNTDPMSSDGWDGKTKGHGIDNDGYGFMLGYNNGPLSLVGNWSRLSDSNNSSVWNLGAAYRFGDVKLELVYQQTRDKGWHDGKASNWNKEYMSDARNNKIEGFNGATDIEIREKQWLLGLEWKLGPGRLNASAQWMEVEGRGLHTIGLDGKEDSDIYKYAIGYTYNLSKRTALYGNVAYTDYDDKYVAAMYGDADDGVVGVQVGITHKF